MASAEAKTEKVLVTVDGANIAPRFDLATEVRVYALTHGKISGQPRSILLPSPSADELCSLVLKENIDVLICGGVTEEHFQFLCWKNVKVHDRVIGLCSEAVKRYQNGTLSPGTAIRKGGGSRPAK